MDIYKRLKRKTINWREKKNHKKDHLYSYLIVDYIETHGKKKKERRDDTIGDTMRGFS